MKLLFGKDNLSLSGTGEENIYICIKAHQEGKLKKTLLPDFCTSGTPVIEFVPQGSLSSAYVAVGTFGTHWFYSPGILDEINSLDMKE